MPTSIQRITPNRSRGSCVSALFDTMSSMHRLQVKAAKEVSELSNVFEHQLPQREISLLQYVNEFNRPCGRFKLPLSWKTRLELQMASHISQSQVFSGMAVLSLYELPPSWQILLNYLSQEGVIASPTFEMRQRPNDLPKGYTVTLKSLFNSRHTDGREAESIGSGNHRSDFIQAVSKSIGELLERHFLTLYKKKSLVRDSFTTMTTSGKNVLPPSKLNRYLPWQQSVCEDVRDWNNDTRFRWVVGKELLSKRRCYIPAQLIFRNYDLAESSEPRLMDLTTNGAAGHFSFEEATTAALCELVQRDGFLVFWLNTLSPPVLDIESIKHPDVEHLLAQFARYHLRVFFLDTTTDIGIPSCACVIVDERGEEPVVTLGGGASFDPIQNILSSAGEAVSIMAREGAAKGFVLPKEYKPFSGDSIIDRKKRLSLWRGDNMLNAFQFFISGPRVPFPESRYMKMVRQFTSPHEELAAMLDIFREKGEGYHIYCHTVRDRILDAVGYHVVKVIVPKLIPLYLTEHRATLDAARLREVPPILGYTKTTLNPWPHPFP